MLTKEPSDVLTFGINWADWLGDLTIASSSWSLPSGITNDADDFTDTATTILVSGGTWGESYDLVNTIVTNDSQSTSRSITIHIQRNVAYVTPAEVRAVATQMTEGTKTTDSPTLISNSELSNLIERASRIFDQACGAREGRFNPVAIPVATARTYYGDGTTLLRLDPYVAGSLVQAVSLPTGYTAPTFAERAGFLLLTNNDGGLQRIGDPWQSGWYYGVPTTVSAIWGYEETPADVKAAVIELVINLWRETDTAHLKLVGLDGSILREALPPRVKEIAKTYQMEVAEAVFA